LLRNRSPALGGSAAPNPPPVPIFPREAGADHRLADILPVDLQVAQQPVAVAHELELC
jgi:hypothetical protein